MGAPDPAGGTEFGPPCSIVEEQTLTTSLCSYYPNLKDSKIKLEFTPEL